MNIVQQCKLQSRSHKDVETTRHVTNKYSKCCQEACWPFLASEDITDRNHTNLKPTSASIQYWWNVNVFFIWLTYQWLTWDSVQTRFLVATRSQESAAAVFSTHLFTADDEVSSISWSYRSRGGLLIWKVTEWFRMTWKCTWSYDDCVSHMIWFHMMNAVCLVKPSCQHGM